MHEASFQRIDLCDLVVSGCRRVEDLAESSGILLDWNLPDDPVFIEGDKQLMQRLLGILLDNAIKYPRARRDLCGRSGQQPRGDSYGAGYRHWHVTRRTRAYIRPFLSSGPAREKVACWLRTGAFDCALDCRRASRRAYSGKRSSRSFLLTNNSNPTYYSDQKYNFYHVPTDFEYVGLKSELGHGWLLDVKPYTYSYNNAQHYANAVGQNYNSQGTLGSSNYIPPLPFGYLTDAPTTNTVNNPYKVTPCNIAVSKKGVTALPCGVDKLNSYRNYGETAAISQTSKLGVFRAGAGYRAGRSHSSGVARRGL